MSWPPTLAEFKLDIGSAAAETRDDAKLQQVLDAAVATVERLRPAYLYDQTDPVQIEAGYLEPPADHVLGTIRLAGRWHTRRRSPDGLVVQAELGSARIGSGDPDIDRMLKIGRFAPPVFA